MAEKYYRQKIGSYKWIFVLSAMLLASCSQTRFVPEQEYLLQKVELEIDNQEVSREEAKSVLRQKENYKILGFIKFYLLLYNMSSKKKTDDWLKRIGEAPELYDKAMADRSTEQLESYMGQRGYYQAKVNQEVHLNEKKRKAKLKFAVEAGDQYKIRRVNYHFETPELQKIFYNDSAKYQMRPGTPFDIYELEKQQKRIVSLYQNNGYYYFSNNQVRYLADSTLYDKQVILDLFIGEPRLGQVDSTKLLKPYYLNNFYYSVMPGNTPVTSNRKQDYNFSDTLVWDNSVLYASEQVSYPPGLFIRTNQMQSGNIYKINEVENTFNALNRLRQFRFVDIQFEETYPEQDTNLLDCNIRLAPLNKQSTSFDIEGTNTSGNLGVAGNIYYQHRNLFKGAEVFQVRLKGATERLHRSVGDGTSEAFNTREFGVETSLMVPKLLGPGKYIKSFGKYLPKTVFNAGYNYQRRPEYTRNITNFKIGYDWKTSQNYQHLWNFLDVNVVRLYEFDPKFVNSIQDLYIKSSFTDHLIFAMNYSLIFNNQRLSSNKNYTYARLNFESSGNLLWAISELAERDLTFEQDSATQETTEYYKMFNIRFAQYIKADVELRKAFQIDRYNYVVGRLFGGVGLPYGNSPFLPFEKQYFSGGANGIRAWQVRSLGPGSYSPEDENAYPNQSSDIKLEANIEYRFRLLGSLEGALFVDAGNIWAINSNDNREGAVFKVDKFYKQFAVGTGTGFRFDLSYFILRTDIGMKLRDPAAAKGERWIIGNRGYKGSDFTFSFAIGYPF